MTEWIDILQSDSFVFDSKWALWLLPLPILILLLPPVSRRISVMRVPDFERFTRLAGLTPRKGVGVSQRSWYQVVLLWLVWIGLVLALANPVLVGEPEKRIKSARNFMIVTDISSSMTVTDWVDSTGSRISRWQAVQQIMGDFIERRTGDRMAFMVFGSEPYIQVPFTPDLEVVAQLLAETEIGMAGQKTAMGNAVGKAIEIFDRDTIETRVMLILTDGVDSGSELNPIQAARLAAADSIVIYSVGIGSTSSGTYELDEVTLRSMADVTNGQYFFAQDNDQLEKVYAAIEDLQPIEYEDEDYVPRKALFYLPLLGALIIALMFHLLAGALTLIAHLSVGKKETAV